MLVKVQLHSAGAMAQSDWSTSVCSAVHVTGGYSQERVPTAQKECVCMCAPAPVHL